MLERVRQHVFEITGCAKHLIVKKEVNVVNCNLEDFFSIELSLLDQDLQSEIVLKVSDLWLAQLWSLLLLVVS